MAYRRRGKRMTEAERKHKRLQDMRFAAMLEPDMITREDMEAWEDMAADNPDADWAMPLWRSVQALRDTSRKNTALLSICDDQNNKLSKLMSADSGWQ